MKKIYILLSLISFVIIVSAQDPVLYALTSAGGTSGKGAIIKYDVSSNQLTADYSFSGVDGEAPQGSLVQATNGLFYGMTRNGGVNNLGVIFSFNHCTNTYTKLYDFGGVDGARPHGSLIQVSNGMLYGMTTFGGTLDRGVIFSYNIDAGGYTKLHDFTGPVNTSGPIDADGARPYGSLLQATDGKLYCMTSAGGYDGTGIALSFDIASSSLVKLWNFGYSNGYPRASFIQAADGYLYYTTNGGTPSQRGYIGSTKPGFVQHAFVSITGTHPEASPWQASDGKLYGTTARGGTPTGTVSLGAVYSFDPITREYKTIVFNGGDPNAPNDKDGISPKGSLIQASNGKLYGMTSLGGVNKLGVIYSVDITTFTRTKLQDFNGSNGANPVLGHFTELRIKCPAPVVPSVTFTLVNSTNDQDIQTLKDGDSINLATLSTTNLNIRANAASSIGSMVFNLSGAQTVDQTESISPYALFGDDNGNYNNWTPSVGSYTLKATPFSGSGGTGTAGTAATINFKVVNIPANGARIASQNINAVGPQANPLNVYPNPSTTGRFTISLPNKYQGEISYSLVSMLGRKITVGKLILKEPTSTVNFDFSHRLIGSGVYYLILEGKGLKKLHAKLMKN